VTRWDDFAALIAPIAVSDHPSTESKGVRMPYLVAAVVVVGALCVVDLLLTLGVIRRLREHTELLSKRPGPSVPEHASLTAGQRPAAFAAVDTDGQKVDQHSTAARLIGFFSTNCPACKDLLPTFVEYAERFPGGRAQVLAVVGGTPPDTDAFTRDLTGAARVVVEEPQGTVATAFQVTGYPAWCLLDEHGVVQDSGLGFDRLPLAVPA
jgi:thiol-disulfide isomerase/thioredoxin